MATPVWFTGWEHGKRPVAADASTSEPGLLAEITGESGTALIVDAAAARTGGFGLRLVSTAGAREIRHYTTGSSVAVHVFSGYIKFPTSLPAANLVLWYTPVNSGVGAILRFNSGTSKFEMRCGTTPGTFQAGTHTVVAEQWYRIEIRVNLGTNRQAEWKVALDDGAAVDQTTATSTDAATDSRYVAFGDSASGSVTATVDYDDWVWSQTSADFPLGPYAVRGFTIDQTVAAEHQSITTSEWQYTDDFSGFTNFASSSETDSRSRLDDLNTSDGVRMNATGAVAGNGRWRLATPAGLLSSSPIGVQMIASLREASTGTNDATIRTLLGGSTTNLFSGNPGWGTTWTYVRTMMTTAPGGAGWSSSDIGSLRFELDSTDASPNIWVGGVYYEVAQAPAAAGGGGSARMLLLGVG